MNKINSISLSTLIEESKDGEWGKGESLPKYREMIVIRGTDFEKIKIGSLEGIPKRFIPLSIANRKKLNPDDILIETAGGTEDNPTGKVVFISDDYLSRYKNHDFTCASFSRFIRIDKNKANPLFIYFYLQFLYDSRISYMFHTQHTGVARFQWTKFSNYKLFLLPDSKKQQIIAAILNTYDALMKVNNQRIKLLEETASELYKEWFVRLRFPEYKNTKFVKGIPEAWELKPILSLCSRITDGTHDTPKPLKEGIPLITGKHLIDGRIDFESAYKISLEDHEKIKRRSGLVKGDILFSNIGTIGSTAVVNEDFEYSVKNVIIFKPALSQYSLFLYYMILSEGVREQMLMDAFGTSQQFISLGYIRKLKTIIPTKNLIFRFSEIVVPMFEQIQNLQQQNTHLRQIRDRLLPRLISGKLQVNFDKVLLNSKTE